MKKRSGVIAGLFGFLGANLPHESLAADVETAIAQMDNWLKTNRPVYYSELKPGVTDAQLNEYAKEFDLILPDAFRALYKWRNGHPDNRTVALVWNHMFIPIEESLSDKREMDGMIGFDFEEGWWERTWLPFTRGYGGDMQVVVANGTADGGKIISFYNDDASRYSSHPSMQAWLEDLVKTMKDGTYEVDGELFTSEVIE